MKKTWSIIQHRKKSPQFNKEIEYLEEQSKKDNKLAIFLCIVGLVFGSLVGYGISNYYYEKGSKAQGELIASFAEKSVWEFSGFDKTTMEIINNSGLTAEQTKTLFNNLERYSNSDYDRAIAYFWGKDYNKSLESINLALNIEPNNDNYLLYKGWILFLLKDYNSSVNYLTLNRLKMKNEYVLWYAKSVSLSLLKKHQEAIDNYKEYAKMCKTSEECNEINFLVAMEYYAIGDYLSAKNWIEKFDISYLSKNDSIPLWYFYEQEGWIYTANKQFEKAKTSYEKAFYNLISNKEIAFKNLNDFDTFVRLKEEICRSQLDAGKLFVIPGGLIKLCTMINPDTNETIYLSQYDEVKDSFVTTYVFSNNKEIKQTNITTNFSNPIGYIDENGYIVEYNNSQKNGTSQLKFTLPPYP